MSSRSRFGLRAFVAAGWLACVPAIAAGRQDTPAPAPTQTVDAHAEGHEAMLETLREIEREMHSLDGYLWSRATASNPPQPARAREALLEAKRRIEREVELIDRVFELAKHDHGEGGM
ncbi:MAG: hypothetical protein HZA52_04505 [Planctomycetes bacterium]|nr:hypothetical protein [Planctomycetota bacterium]